MVYFGTVCVHRSLPPYPNDAVLLVLGPGGGLVLLLLLLELGLACIAPYFYLMLNALDVDTRGSYDCGSLSLIGKRV